MSGFGYNGDAMVDMIRVYIPVIEPEGAWYTFMLFEDGMIKVFLEGTPADPFSMSWFLPEKDLANWGKIVDRANELSRITNVERYPRYTPGQDGHMIRGVVLHDTGLGGMNRRSWKPIVTEHQDKPAEPGREEELPDDAWMIFFEEEGA